MNNLYNLTKKIDSMTYNACQVLNAMIRSCIASGSSSGYTVNKYGNEIKLTRQDIYRLYNFYESWKMAGFPSDETTFYKMLSEADGRWGTGTLATDAVVKHVQILKMTAADKGMTGSEYNEYWTEMLRKSASPSSMVSSAPIPLNLRTPLYDENLSVKSFSQYETYLFPMGYYRNEIMGTPGNGESYLAGGANWTIDVTDTLMLTANRIVAGNVTNPQNRIDNYGNSRITLSWGDESYAVGNCSLAVGNHSVAVADGSIATGERAMTFYTNAVALGGADVLAIGGSSLATNNNTRSGGLWSISGNNSTITGGYEYAFTFVASSTAAVTDLANCDYVYDTTENACVKTNALQNVQESMNQVLSISQSTVDFSGLGDIDLRPGDRVYVYYTHSTKDGLPVYPTDDAGYASKRFFTTVVSVTPIYDNGEKVEYHVTLEQPVPVENPKYGPITGGRIMAMRRNVLLFNKDENKFIDSVVELGQASNAFNHYTLASGENQTVVGQMNIPNYDAKFIVGGGTGDDIRTTRNAIVRANSMVVSPYYSYMKLADGGACVGVSAISGKVPDKEETTLYSGAYLHAVDSSGTEHSAVRCTGSATYLMYEGVSGRSTMTLENNVTINANDTMSLMFSDLFLSGDTRGALPTTANCMSHLINTSASNLRESGFFYVAGEEYLPLSLNSGSAHVLTSAILDTSTRKYFQGGLMIPALINSANSELARPVVFANGPYSSTSTVGYTLCKPLAYLDDISKSSMFSTGGMSPMGYYDTTGVALVSFHADGARANMPSAYYNTSTNKWTAISSSTIDNAGNDSAGLVMQCGDGNAPTGLIITDFVYTLNGNSITMTFKLIFKYHSGDSGDLWSIMKDRPLMLRAAFRIGCVCDSTEFDNATMPGYNEDNKGYTLVYGKVHDDWDSTIRGRVWRDGTVALEILGREIVHNMVTMNNGNGTPLECVVTGPVPFLPASNTTGVYKGYGENITWDRAVKSDTTTITYEALNTFIAPAV